MYITGYRWTNPIDFGERMHRFFFKFYFTEVQKNVIQYGLWCQIIISVRVSKWCTLSELKLDAHIISHHPIYYTDFDELFSTFTGINKKFLIQFCSNA